MSLSGVYVLNQFPSTVMLGMKGFHVSASGAIHGHHGPLVHVMMPFNNISLRAKLKKRGHEYQSLSTKKSHCTNHRIMKTENYVMVPFDSISLRTKFKENKNHEYQSL